MVDGLLDPRPSPSAAMCSNPSITVGGAQSSKRLPSEPHQLMGELWESTTKSSSQNPNKKLITPRTERKPPNTTLTAATNEQIDYTNKPTPYTAAQHSFAKTHKPYTDTPEISAHKPPATRADTAADQENGRASPDRRTASSTPGSAMTNSNTAFGVALAH